MTDTTNVYRLMDEYDPSEWVIGPGDDVIDGRQVEERINELELTDSEDLSVNEAAELEELNSLLAGAGHPDFTAVREDYFAEYAQDYASGLMDGLDDWPCCHIDWEAAADSLKIDYSMTDFAGARFYVR